MRNYRCSSRSPKSVHLVRERPAVKFAAIAGWIESGEYDVEFMCRQLSVSRSGYYAWRGRPDSDPSATDKDLTSLIRVIYQRLRGNPGVRWVRAELAGLGGRISHKRVWRLMHAADCRDGTRRRGARPASTVSSPHRHRI